MLQKLVRASWCVSISQAHCPQELAILVGKKLLREAGKALMSVKTVRAFVQPAVFIHISFAMACVCAQEQQETAMC